MKRKYHLSASGAVALLVALKDLFGEIKGTGQTLLDLLRTGWSFWDVHRFPLMALNLFLIGAAAVWFAFHVRSGQGKDA